MHNTNLSEKQKKGINNQINYQAYRLQRRLPYLEREEIESEIQFFMYKRKDKFDPSKTSYYTYMINLIKWGAKSYIEKQKKISFNEISMENYLTEKNESKIKREILKKLIYNENYIKKIEEYEIREQMKKFGIETKKVYDLLNSNLNITEIERELEITRWHINKIIKNIKHIVRNYYE